jgi:hypothetical protein
MSRRLEIIILALVALGTGGVGGITSSLADETGIEVGVGDLRDEVLSLAFPKPATSAAAIRPLNVETSRADWILTLALRRPALRRSPVFTQIRLDRGFTLGLRSLARAESDHRAAVSAPGFDLLPV